MYVLIWEYGVRADQVDVFEAAYGADGAWSRLFAKAPGYLGTDLFRSSNSPTTFVTVDRWESEADWQGFRAGWGREYEALDGECEALTEWERRLAPAH
jgi:heme-degrading monooxygenase HmoA